MRVKVDKPIDEEFDLQDVEPGSTILSLRKSLAKLLMKPIQDILIFENENLKNDDEKIPGKSQTSDEPFVVRFASVINKNADVEDNLLESEPKKSPQASKDLEFSQSGLQLSADLGIDVAKTVSQLSAKLLSGKKQKVNNSIKNSPTPPLQLETRQLKDEALKKVQYNLEKLSPEVSLHEYIHKLNMTLPQDVTLDVGALARTYVDNEYNIHAASTHFPQFTVGYLEFVLYWVVKTVTERICSQNSWSMEENRFIIEMAAMSHSFREIDALITYHRKNDEHKKSEEHRKAIRRTMKRSWIIPLFAEQFPDCSQYPPGYNEDGVPAYLPELMTQIVKKPKSVEDEKIIHEALNNPATSQQFRKAIVKLAQKLIEDPSEFKQDTTEEEEDSDPALNADEFNDAGQLVADEKHTRSNWPLAEDQLLLNRYAEAKNLNTNRWEYIKKSFPNRSTKAISAHYKILFYDIKANKRSDLTIPPQVLDELVKERTYNDEVKTLSVLNDQEMIDIIEAIRIYYQENGNWSLISRRLPQFKGGYIAYLLYYVCTSLKKTRKTKTWSMTELRFLLEKRVDGVPVQEISDLLQNKSPKQVDTKRTQIYSTIRNSPFLKQFVERFGKCDKEGAVYDENGIPSYLPPMLETFKSEIREAMPELQ